MSPGLGGPRHPQTRAAGGFCPGGSSTPHHTGAAPSGGRALDQTPAGTLRPVIQARGPCAPQVRQLIDKVRAVFVETLDELGWMDAASKKKAQEKVGGRPESRGQGLRQERAVQVTPHTHPL